MSFDINSKIVTELTYKEVALISIALRLYRKRVGDDSNEESKDAARLCNRLGDELYNVQTTKNSKKIEIMSRDRLEPRYIGDGIYVHDEGWRIVLAVNDASNKVVYMAESEIIGLIKYAKETGLLTQERLDKL